MGRERERYIYIYLSIYLFIFYFRISVFIIYLFVWFTNKQTKNGEDVNGDTMGKPNFSDTEVSMAWKISEHLQEIGALDPKYRGNVLQIPSILGWRDGPMNRVGFDDR